MKKQNKQILTKEGWLKIGREYGQKGPTVLAKELGVSKQRIQQITTTLRKKGANIPYIRQYGLASEIAEILKKEALKN